MSTAGCAEIEELFTDYIGHRTSERLVQVIEEHLCVCDACRSRLNSLLEQKDNSAREKGLRTPADREKEIGFEEIAEKEKESPAEKQVELKVLSEKKSAFFLYFIFAVAVIMAVFIIFLFLRY